MDFGAAGRFLERFHIRDRDSHKSIPFRLNYNQRKIHDIARQQQEKSKPIRILVDKSRRVGVSSWAEGILFCQCVNLPGAHDIIAAHEFKSSKALFSIPKGFAKQAYWLGLRDVEREITFPHRGEDSLLQIITAGKDTSGRGFTLAGLHLCLDGNSLVMTGDGNLVAIRHLRPGDTVWTHTGYKSAVKAISYRPTEEVSKNSEMIEIRSWMNHERLSVTPDHKMWTPRGWVAAKKLVPNDELGTPVRKIKDTLWACTTEAVRDSLGRKKRGRDVIKLLLNKQFGFFCGYYLAEGNLHGRLPQYVCSVNFTHHQDEKNFADLAIDAVKQYTTSSRTVKRAGKKAVTSVYGSALARFIRDNFGTKDEKRIPDWVFDCSKEFVRGIVLGYLAGDGSKTIARKQKYECPTIYVTSVRPRLLYQLRHCLAATDLGWGGITHEDQFLDSRGVNNRESWTLSISGVPALRLRKYLGLESTSDKERPNRKRTSASKYRIENGYVWTKIRSLRRTTSENVWDIEVDHPDHSFETVVGAVANSEAAHYKSAEPYTSIIPAVSNHKNTIIIIESTPNGMDGDGEVFYSMWLDAVSGRSEYEACFLSWTDDPACVADPELAKDAPIDKEERSLLKRGLNKAQLSWRRLKISSPECGGHIEKFHQEFPCIAKGTLVNTDKGLVPIEEVTANSKCEFGVIRYCVPKGTRKVIKLNFKSGNELVCTADHRIRDINGCYHEAQEMIGKTTQLYRTPFAEKSYSDITDIGLGRERHFSMNPSLARLIGYFMGDGSFDGSSCLSFACYSPDKDTIEDIEGLLSWFVGKPTKRSIGYKGQASELRVFGQTFKTFMQEQGFYNVIKPHRKVCVPKCILRSDRESVKQFLRGVFETDGHANLNYAQVRMFSKHKSFVLDIRLLLLGFGIPSFISKESKGSHTGYSLRILAHEAVLFHELIGFVGQRKIDRGNRTKVTNGIGRPRRPAEWRDEVISIEDAGTTEVFDLCVDGLEHAFVANGVPVHNCNWQESFITSGYPAFQESERDWASANVKKPKWQGFIDRTDDGSLKLRQHSNGDLCIWEDPIPGHFYYIGADAARGDDDKDGRDFAANVGIDGNTGHQAYRFAGHVVPEVHGCYLNSLGRHYNRAMLNGELTGGYGYNTLYVVRDHLKYPNLYRWKGKDDKVGSWATGKSVWYETTQYTRTVLFESLRASLREGAGTRGEFGITIYDEQTAAQIRLCTRQDCRVDVRKGHDDILFGQMLANIAMRQYSPPRSVNTAVPRIKEEDDEVKSKMEMRGHKIIDDAALSLQNHYNKIMKMVERYPGDYEED